MAEDQNHEIEFSVNRQNLYREESFTDMKVASIRRLTPVKSDGSEDKSRKEIFVGQTSLITPNGPVPIQALIDARQLQQAIKKFPEAMQKEMERLVEEMQKLKQEKESRIIVPGR
ncbi:MAG: cytoplasmic protein [Deltaproteobacteria bacterium]|nr:cytoplasmic protein [Deltaproteobacteria bacterium]